MVDIAKVVPIFGLKHRSGLLPFSLEGKHVSVALQMDEAVTMWLPCLCALDYGES